MAAQSLYRTYRPQTFAALVGQEHVITALRNAVREDRVGHAYLFSGPRGTGKTSTARILAKALNCTNRGDDGEPCGECASCLSVTAGNALDVIEIDAASNNRVEEVRELIERVAFSAAGGGRKVYIVDEVHELTDRASNALLKTLEEPPDHVVFVLATTNPEKVLPTIRSRTQHFEFTLLSTEQLSAHLVHVMEREGVEFESGALDVVARRGGGSARDSLSLLDQALAVANGPLTTDVVEGMFGGTPFDQRLGVLHALGYHDAAAGVVALAELFSAGYDSRRIAEDLLRAARDAFLLDAAPDLASIDRSDDERAALIDFGATAGTAGLINIIETLGQALVDMRGTDAADPRLVLEVAVVRLAHGGGGSLDALAARVERLEAGRSVTTGVPEPASAPRPPVDRMNRRTPAPDPAPVVASASTESPGAASPPSTRRPAATPSAGSPPAESPVETGAKMALGALRRSRATTNETSAPESAPDPSLAATEVAATGGAKVVPATVELDDVVLAWASILSTLSPATRSAVQDAQPVRLQGDVVTFAVPSEIIDTVKPRFKKAAADIRAALVAQLGVSFKFMLEPGDVAGSPSPPPAVDVTPPTELPEDLAVLEEIESIDPSELVDATDIDVKPSAVSKLESQFGATVVDERPRE